MIKKKKKFKRICKRSGKNDWGTSWKLIPNTCKKKKKMWLGGRLGDRKGR